MYYLSAIFIAALVAGATAVPNVNDDFQKRADATQVVQVGPGGSIQFSPASITASNGTIVTFVFNGPSGNHSVTQSSFESPCQPLSGGFDSGLIDVPSASTSDLPEWNITITDDSTPIWFYCMQLIPGPHCTLGMVGAINAPTSGNTFANFQAAAKSSSGTPGVGEGALVGVGASASAPPGPFSGGNTGYALPTGTAPSGSSSTSSGGGSGSATKAPSTTTTAPSSTTSASSSGKSGASVLNVKQMMGMVILSALVGVMVGLW